MNFLPSVIIGTLLGLSSIFGLTQYLVPEVQNILAPKVELQAGADTQLFVGGQTYTLAGSGITSSATSVTLTSLTIPQTGQLLLDADFSSTFYATIEPGSTARQEFVSCTTVTQNGNGTATLSGCSRGLSPIAPYTASTTLQFAHAGGTKLIFSNSPQLYDQATFKGNDETITGLWTFDDSDTYRARIDADTDTAVSTAFVTLGQLSRQAISGASNGSETVKGIFELATALETASSTVTGGTSANLVLSTAYATDTPTYGCSVGYTAVAGAGCTPIAQLTGKIRQGWLNLTELFTFSGGITSTATTTLAGSNVLSNALVINGLAYALPSSRAASSTVLTENGSGTLKWMAPQSYVLAQNTAVNTGTSATATTSLATIAVPAGTLTAGLGSINVKSFWNMVGASDVCGYQIDVGTGSATSTIFQSNDINGTSAAGRVSFMDTTIMATSSTAVISMVEYHGDVGQGTISNVVRNYITQFNINTANKMYISLGARALAGTAVCTVYGYTATFDSN